MVDTVRIEATRRTEFGKGASRRARAAGLVPAVLYGHHTDPAHFTLPSLEFARAVRGDANRILTIALDGEEHLALPRAIVRHPVKDYFQHVDLLLIKRGEKVIVEVPVQLVGDAAPGTMVLHETMQLSIEVDALEIPERLDVNIEGLQAGTVVHAPAVQLPGGATLVTDDETVILAVQEVVEVSDEDEEAAEATEEVTDEAAATDDASGDE